MNNNPNIPFDPQNAPQQDNPYQQDPAYQSAPQQELPYQPEAAYQNAPQQEAPIQAEDPSLQETTHLVASQPEAAYQPTVAQPEVAFQSTNQPQVPQQNVYQNAPQPQAPYQNAPQPQAPYQNAPQAQFNPYQQQNTYAQQPPYQQPNLYTQQPTYQQPNPYAQQQFNPYQQSAQPTADKSKDVVSMGEWFWSFLLMLIPGVNIIMMFVFAFGSKKENKRTCFKALLLFGLICFILSIILIVAVIIPAIMSGEFWFFLAQIFGEALTGSMI